MREFTADGLSAIAAIAATLTLMRHARNIGILAVRSQSVRNTPHAAVPQVCLPARLRARNDAFDRSRSSEFPPMGSTVRQLWVVVLWFVCCPASEQPKAVNYNNRCANVEVASVSRAGCVGALRYANRAEAS